MVSNPEVFTDNISISSMTSTQFKKPRAQKSVCLFPNILDVKKTATRRVGAAKSKPRQLNL